MNRNDFLNMIEGTVPVNRQILGEVYELINIFPYFQSAHLLLLKGLHQCADVKFENQLRNSAIHVGDREVLYWLLRKKSSAEEEKASIKKVIEFKEEISSDTQQTVIESAKNSEYMISEIEKNEDTVGSDVKVVYMDPGFSVPEHSDLLELDLDEDMSLMPAVPEHESENPDVANKNSKKLIQSELIDKFIIANPRIETVRDKSTVITEDISKPFLEESGGLVTETLAKIYVNQGYYSKAIDIYEKLSLKFPEKSSYFASQIEKVEDYIKK